MRTLELDAWVFTDPHFNHEKLVERGYRPKGYEAAIRCSWETRVKPGQAVYCLGDVAMGPDKAGSHENYIRPMPGRKILLKGNHDKQKDEWYLERGWDECYETLMLAATVNGKHTRVLLSHIPQIDDGSWDINLHGHFHDDTHRAKTPEMQAILTPRHRLMALELLNYQLVPLLGFLEAGTNHLNDIKERVQNV